MDWKDRLKGLMLETVGRVKPRPTYTTPPEPSAQQQAQIDQHNYQQHTERQRRVGQQHRQHFRAENEKTSRQKHIGRIQTTRNPRKKK